MAARRSTGGRPARGARSDSGRPQPAAPRGGGARKKKSKNHAPSVRSTVRLIRAVGPAGHASALFALAAALDDKAHATALRTVAAEVAEDVMLGVITDYVSRKTGFSPVEGATKWSEVGITDGPGKMAFFTGIKRELVEAGFVFKPGFNDATVLQNTDDMDDVRGVYQDGLQA